MPLGRVQGFEPLSALPRTLELEDPMIPEKQNVINCVRVAYFQIIGMGTSCNGAPCASSNSLSSKT